MYVCKFVKMCGAEENVDDVLMLGPVSVFQLTLKIEGDTSWWNEEVKEAV